MKKTRKFIITIVLCGISFSTNASDSTFKDLNELANYYLNKADAFFQCDMKYAKVEKCEYGTNSLSENFLHKRIHCQIDGNKLVRTDRAKWNQCVSAVESKYPVNKKFNSIISESELYSYCESQHAEFRRYSAGRRIKKTVREISFNSPFPDVWFFDCLTKENLNSAKSFRKKLTQGWISKWNNQCLLEFPGLNLNPSKDYIEQKCLDCARHMYGNAERAVRFRNTLIHTDLSGGSCLDDKYLAIYKNARIQSPPKYFMGYKCTEDCSGHEAGYNWAKDNWVDTEEYCQETETSSNSFIEGCLAFVDEQM